MSLQNIGKGALRVAKNYTKGYSDIQAKVREATSNDPWGPSGTQMNELAQSTYNQNDFVEIMEMLDKRLNDKGKNWRHVFKALTVLDYCLHAGSENVVVYFRDNVYVVKTLREFQFVDEYGKDQGANVRQKAKDITNLLMDESRLREERKSRAHMRDRMTRGPGGGDDDDAGARPPRSRTAPPRGGGDDDEMRKAIEESKRSAAQEQAQRAEANDLERAIKMSEEEDAERRRKLEEENQRGLFDDTQQLATQSTNPFPLVDTSGNTQGLAPQFGSQYGMQPQMTSFNPYAQYQQQEAMQAEYLRNQQDWARQQQEMQAAAQAQAQQEEWMRQQQMLQFQQQQQQQQQQQAMLQAQQQQQYLTAQPTGFGSNNPFAQGFGGPTPPPPMPSFPPSNGSTNGLGTSLSTPSLSIPSTQSPAPNASSPSPRPQPKQARSDGEHAHLATLLGNRIDDGMDTFGNVGATKYGHTQAGITAQRTGANPFQMQQMQMQSQGQHGHQQADQPFFTL